MMNAKRCAAWMVVVAAGCSVQTEQLEGLPGPAGEQGPPGEPGSAADGGLDPDDYMLTGEDTGTTGTLTVGGTLGVQANANLDHSWLMGPLNLGSAEQPGAWLGISRPLTTPAFWTAIALTDEASDIAHVIARTQTDSLHISVYGTEGPEIAISPQGNVGIGAEPWAGFRLHVDGDVNVTGELFTTGGTCTSGCDRVFAPDYDLPAIDEHAAYMWSHRHLPAVGSTKPRQPMNLTEKTVGILNEVETAHIYVEQLHRRLKDQERELAALRSANRAFEKRLASIERRLSASADRQGP